jgi:hypothetical protein
MQDPNQVSYFAETDARNKRIPFGIKAKDRSRHMYVIGKTGMGKSTLLENLAVQDLRNGNGICFIDPHGKTADLLLEYVPKERIKDVLYFAPFDIEHPIAFNVMEDVGYDKRHLVVSGLMSTFKKIWQDAWSARMEYILSNALLALLEYPGSTLLSVNKMLSDKKYRQKVVDNITDASVKSFWVDEFGKYTEKFAAEATPAIQNKIGQFTANPLIRNIVGQPKSSFDFRELMDERKIVIINLSKGRIGEVNAQLLGSMIVTKIYLAAMSRADKTEAEMENIPNFYLFVDEFQSFANESFADILSEARKYKLNLTITHQYIEQMPEEVRAAVFGNVGTFISFRVGAADAEYIEKEFAPTFMATDIVNLGFVQIYLRLMIDGIGSQPFSARTLPPIVKPEQHYVDEIILSSREQYAHDRAGVEAVVRELLEDGREDSSPKPKDGAGSAGKSGGSGTSAGGSVAGARDSKKGNEQRASGYKAGTPSGAESSHAPRAPRAEKEQSLEPMIDAKTKEALQAALLAKQEKKFEKPEPDEIDVAEESLSLQQLLQKKPTTAHKADPKQVSPENRNDLKSALAKALGDALPSTSAPAKQAPATPPSASAATHKPPVEPDVPQEISEDDLRKILDVNA